MANLPFARARTLSQFLSMIAVLALGLGIYVTELAPVYAGAGQVFAPGAGSFGRPSSQSPAIRRSARPFSGNQTEKPFRDRQFFAKKKDFKKREKGFSSDVFGYTSGYFLPGAFGPGQNGTSPQGDGNGGRPFGPIDPYAGLSPELYAPPRIIEINGDAGDAGQDQFRRQSRASYNGRVGGDGRRVARAGGAEPGLRIIRPDQDIGSSASVGYDPRFTAYNRGIDPFAPHIIRVRVPKGGG